jgi:hypothetical protein
MAIRRCRSCQFIGAQAARVEGVRGVQHEEHVETISEPARAVVHSNGS